MSISWVAWKANEAITSGEVQQLSSDSSSKLSLTTAAGGSRIAYVAATSMGRPVEIRIRDIASGHEELIVPSGGLLGANPRLSADGSRLAYRDSVDGKVATYVTDPGVTSAHPVCEGCTFHQFFSNAAEGLVTYGNQLVRQNLATGIRQPLLEVKGAVLYEASVSPGDGWVAFTVARPEGTARLYTAPVRDQPVPPDAWIPIAEERNHIMSPKWSPDGKLLYFGSNRDTFPCVWAQRISSDGKPAGAPIAAFHSHGSAGMKLWHFPLFDITPERLYMMTIELKGNIWTINVGRE
jgi:Tol biopolymer transport system component